MSNLSILVVQTTDRFKEATLDERAEIVKLVLVSEAFSRSAYGADEIYSSDKDIAEIRQCFDKIAADVVDSVNEVFPLPFDESVAFVSEALMQRYLVNASDTTAESKRLAAIAGLVGISVDVKGLVQV